MYVYTHVYRNSIHICVCTTASIDRDTHVCIHTGILAKYTFVCVPMIYKIIRYTASIDRDTHVCIHTCL